MNNRKLVCYYHMYSGEVLFVARIDVGAKPCCNRRRVIIEPVYPKTVSNSLIECVEKRISGFTGLDYYEDLYFIVVGQGWVSTMATPIFVLGKIVPADNFRHTEFIPAGEDCKTDKEVYPLHPKRLRETGKEGAVYCFDSDRIITVIKDENNNHFITVKPCEEPMEYHKLTEK